VPAPLVVTRRLPAAIHAGTPFLVGIAVRNPKKRIPTFSLEVEDMVANKRWTGAAST